MEITELKKALMPILGSMAEPNVELENFKYNDLTAEKIKSLYSLEDRKKEYSGLVWASHNPDFDFRTLIPDDDNYKINFSKDDVYKLLMDLKIFYEETKYNLLTDNRKPKERWEF